MIQIYPDKAGFMNRFIFALRNFSDKFGKVLSHPQILLFYWHTYVASKFNQIEPDIYVVSYPKCGRTWLRHIFEEYLKLSDAGCRQFPDKTLLTLPTKKILKFEHDQGTWVPFPPRIDQLTFNSRKYANRKVIFMVRDPRDVVVSSWYHLKYRENIYTDTISDFIHDDLIGIRKIVAFMNMWLESGYHLDDFLLITYEQLHQNPYIVFREILEFCEVPVISACLEQSVVESSFEKMKQGEIRQKKQEPWLRPGTKNSESSMKIRKGKIGSYKEELSSEDIIFLDEIINKTLTSQLPYGSFPE